jgi:nicotinate-nucleotide pyrophosphorylase (carboxylating)
MDKQALQQAIISFLAEDIGSGDVTSEAIFAPDVHGTGRFIAKEPFVAAGLKSVAAEVFKTQNSLIAVTMAAPDGHRTRKGETVLEVKGPVLDLLKAERVALNLTQRLCGIATLTARFVGAVELLDVKIVDTRKTTPGLRMLEKYAVRVGGGHNHRYNLADAVLIKDNHIAAAGSISEAVRKVRQTAPHTMKIEVETENLDQVRESLDCRADIIMLDNMEPAVMKEAVALVAGKALLEASGGITLENVRQAAETGVDIISIGALTHSARACDISMEIETAR